ncbi:golgi-body localization protein domain-containing protein [Amylocarpus encephaloides]|uniref:Golgi-body localization protein domain-containing protein n=1 Tax=Amylocarpus encephaloides TaxID=45428 RepID=A0A9P8CBD6_9HELO|nr:golgi-body localization protein domain-containing protein [Amylocarpus encephaloides]
MIRPEISDGVRQIVRQLRVNVEPEKKARPNTSRNPNFIRGMPHWLLHFQIQGSDFSAEVAGVDDDISDDTRGVALQLESWTAEYRAQKVDAIERRSSRHRAGSRSLTPDAELYLKMPIASRKKQQHPTDGRRLTVYVRGLETFVVESTERWEVEPFVAIPRFEVALSTTDNQGPIFHVNSYVKTLLVQYSLYHHYACGVATTVLRRAFLQTKVDMEEAAQARAAMAKQQLASSILTPMSPEDVHSFESAGYPFPVQELITVDLKSTLLQIKAYMPSDPPIMLQIYGMEAGRHRWSPPFLHAKLARLYAEAPKMPKVWARLVSLKTLRVDLRENRRKRSTGEVIEDKMIDVTTEAIRLAVPHQLVLHKIFDNFVNTLKSVQQLHHRFSTGTNEYILEKRPEGPKAVPKVSLRSRALLFEVEDGAFEWKLGTIYRAGLIEQQQRIARESAFEVKTKKVREEEFQRDPTKHRNRSAHPRGRSNYPEDSRRRSKSEDNHHSDTQHRGRRMRYDPEGSCGLTGRANVTLGDARERLQRHNAQSWKARIDRVFSLSQHGMKDLRGVFWGPDELPDDMEDTENILEVPQRPSLMATLISDLHITIDKPSFPISQLPEFMHRVGKGMPYDTKYSLLIPMHVQLNMGEARVSLRDYPLPLLHVPAIKPGQSARLPAWSLKTDFVIAEEFRVSESTRHVQVEIIPPKNREPGTSNAGGFAIDVRRTVSPVKSYSDIKVDINTSYPTRITWGSSYQPAIQDMMMVIETFTKPQVDPSDRTGFWDKIRLSFHSRVSVAWKGDGDVHLMLKGTRDPYAITGNGAGFLMCWRSDVRWNICREEDPRKFMTVDSGEYILAIPDFSQQARNTERQERDDASIMSSDSFKRGASFKKVVMKLSGNVQWMAGLMFERNLEDGKRSFDFEPHYKVILKEPKFAKAPPGLEYDAFRGFRSHHIHMSLAVKAPVDREWTVSNSAHSKSYNTVHLTPRFFTHFFAWWSIFGGAMALPIRQGALWPGIEKSSKKFGRHLASIKYNLLLAPLFLSHIYKHKDAEDYSADVVSATGLKMRLDSFMLDVHQRREEFLTQDRGRKTQTKTTGMKMHQAQLDLLSADIRAISASIAGTTPEDLKKASAASLVAQQVNGVTDLSRFEIPDKDLSWIDMDDFVELDWILPSEANPETKIMPLAYAPRFTYFRQTDHGDGVSGDPNRSSPFGNEPTHFCIMSKDDDPRRVQCQLIQTRLDQLDRQIESHDKAIGDAELEQVKDEHNESLKFQFQQLLRHGHVLREKHAFLESMLQRMKVRIYTDNKSPVLDGDADVDSDGEVPMPKDNNPESEGMDTNPADFPSDFNNRFVIHNMQLKWNNMLRNIILRYIHQVSQRRGFVYYLSRRAVKFILDIVEEQHKAKTGKPTPNTQTNTSSDETDSTSADGGGLQDVQDRINELLSDGKSFVSANDRVKHTTQRVSVDNLEAGIAHEFTPQNSYHLRLIAPQIQLQSEKNSKSVVLVTAKGMELKVIEVMDKDRMYDDVSGLVQRRFSVEMDSTQFFVTQQKWFSHQVLSMYSGSFYGTPAGTSWPPWVPMEVMFDFQRDPFGFKRVVQKTSASLRYDKYNTLRLKYNDEISGGTIHPTSPNNLESRMDHLWVEFPQVRALCNSSQYYAMYIIVMDLLMYSEPLEKTRNERLEKIMLASDFSDLRGAPEMVVRLQERISQLEQIKTQFQIHSKYLDKQGWEDRMTLDKDLTRCEDELFFMMKAITSSQRKYDGTQTAGLLRWNISSEQIVWHLVRDNNDPLMEFQLQRAEYDRTDNSDGSHINLLQIGKIVGLNLLPDAIYPEMFAPYSDAERGTFSEGGNQQMLRVYWYMLEAIAGIPVLDHFEVNLFPMKIQLEREVGKRLFEYMFPGSNEDKAAKNKSPFMVKHMQPLDDDDGGDDDDTTPFSSGVTITDVDKDSASNTRAGSLELRLQPTMNSETRPATSYTSKHKAVSIHSSKEVEGHHFRLFQSSKVSAVKMPTKKPSLESLSSSRPTINRSMTTASNYDASSTTSDAKSKRFGIHRNGSKQKEQPSDDLTKMMSRASEYMTLAYVKIPSVVLCLSYKGKGERNIEDVHDFVFRLPMIEYRNKTWSNLDLALALKKDVIKALISHTGAIIGNKFSKHRPNVAQQSRLRELATSSMVLAPSNEGSHENSDTSSTLASSPTGKRSDRDKSPRRSFASSRNGLVRTPSESSSTQSYPGRLHALPKSLTMTPARYNADRDSVTESFSSGLHSIKDSHLEPSEQDRSSGLVAALNRLKKKTGDGASTPMSEDNTDDSSRKKSKILLGKKILGGL